MLKLSDYNYILPQELIAQYPLKERDSARLMVINRNKGTIEHRFFKDITEYISKDDLVVLNDTKVMPARIFGSRITGGKVEFLLLKCKTDLLLPEKDSLRGYAFEALIRPNRIKLEEKIIFDGGKIYAERTAKDEVTFYAQSLEDIYNHGVIPLPPYIKREPREADNIYYQTVYARENGSIAAPTAGLHFSNGLMDKLESGGVNIAYVTLHVGYATFKPVKSEDITKHAMGREYFTVSEKTSGLINSVRSKQNKIFAVGTTALRTLETYALGKKEGYTDLYIYPGYKFKLADCLITNFHLPRTTLYMLVCAFGYALGQEKLIKDAYQVAVDKKYRFYSYGDAMLVI
jgi:S-adenosylmethionine:tRNA ribosyltransferase-isomerase